MLTPQHTKDKGDSWVLHPHYVMYPYECSGLLLHLRAPHTMKIISILHRLHKYKSFLDNKSVAYRNFVCIYNSSCPVAIITFLLDEKKGNDYDKSFGERKSGRNLFCFVSDRYQHQWLQIFTITWQCSYRDTLLLPKPVTQ